MKERRVIESGQSLDELFDAKSVAVVGASSTPGKWGFGIISLILTKGGRQIHVVNKRGGDILGLKAYRSLRDVPGPVDVAVVATAAQDTPAAIADCVHKGVKFAIVFSGGFSEVGEEGARAERELVETARRGGVRLVGPNCMGHFDAHSGFFTLPYDLPVKRGPISAISQSGNSGVSLLTALCQVGLGLSKYVSTGNEADLHFEDYLEYLGADEETGVILGYVEGFRESRRFFSQAREITRKKPVIILKAGRSDDGARAARSHTAALAGSDSISTAAFKQCGVIRVDELTDLVDTAQALTGQPLPGGRRVGLFSMGGGLGVISTDAVRRYGLEMARLSPRTMERLDSVLSSRWSRGNPVDPAGDPILYPCIWPLLEDENVDAVMVVGGVGIVGGLATLLSLHQSFKDEYDQLMEVAEREELDNLDRLAELRERYGKPVIVVRTITGSSARQSPRVAERLERNHLTPFPSPDRAAKALAHLVQYSEYLGVARGRRR